MRSTEDASGARDPNILLKAPILLGLLIVLSKYSFLTHIIHKYLKRFNAAFPAGSIKRYHQLRFLSLSPLTESELTSHIPEQSYIATPPVNHSALHSHASCQSLSTTQPRLLSITQHYTATPPVNHSLLHSHASCQSLSITQPRLLSITQHVTRQHFYLAGYFL